MVGTLCQLGGLAEIPGGFLHIANLLVSAPAAQVQFGLARRELNGPVVIQEGPVRAVVGAAGITAALVRLLGIGHVLDGAQIVGERPVQVAFQVDQEKLWEGQHPLRRVAQRLVSIGAEAVQIAHLVAELAA